MNIRDIKAETTARLAALGRKTTSDLEIGDVFMHSGERGIFMGWKGPSFPGRDALHRLANVATEDKPNGVVWSLNQAGSVEIKNPS